MQIQNQPLRNIDLFESLSPFNDQPWIEKFTAQYPTAMEILKLGGVHPDQSQNPSLTNPYTNTPHTGDYSNIGRHCIAVAACFEAIAKPLVDNQAISQAEFENGIQRALIHDATKRFETMRRDYLKTNSGNSYSSQAYEEVIKKIGPTISSPELLEYLTHAGVETGHNSLPNFLVNNDSRLLLIEGSLVQKVIHLSDDMTASSIPFPGSPEKTYFVTPELKMLITGYVYKYPWMWTQGFGFSSDKVQVVDNLVSHQNELEHCYSYAKYQPLVSNAIAAEIVTLTNSPIFTGNPEDIIMKQVNTYVSKQ